MYNHQCITITPAYNIIKILETGFAVFNFYIGKVANSQNISTVIKLASVQH